MRCITIDRELFFMIATIKFGSRIPDRVCNAQTDSIQTSCAHYSEENHYLRPTHNAVDGGTIGRTEHLISPFVNNKKYAGCNG